MKIVALVVVLLAVFGVAAASATGRGEPGRPAAVLARGELRVCSTGDYRPFTYRDPAGRWSGIDVDLAGDLAHRLGVRPTLVQTTWAQLAHDVGSRCDLAMGGISVTAERARLATYSTSYQRDGKTPITRCADVARFGTPEQIDRPEVRVVVNPGGTNEKYVRTQLRRATVVPYPDNNTIFGELLAGRADLMITDASETRWQARQHPQLCAVHPDHPFTDDEKAYLLPRNPGPLLDYVNGWLRAIREDGTYAAVTQRWFG
ncbi:transporter substrate-binding domain-containing protein [Amycolatopsis jiangsuensis]|uniref:Cyclohexadienyl dehydratase n=1 Tax=Amycolatopsis jiangsuensis TaxID=1181879 RepID=A0A840J3B5_9PSEU|nr:transporter substrate-binding domain-containing protein [Amycolatopsis jiangsuensis]MBB4687947.1 cyclohexadienyl dehydratase [Amycolatopsis jiangsuensis]